MRVALATVQVPYLTGGAEALADGLKAALVARGHAAEIVTLPFRFFPADEVERAMRAWEAEDFTRLNMYEPERVICLKFPAYALRHPNKSSWLCHQHRGAYDLFDAAKAPAQEQALKRAIEAFDARHLATLEPRCTISRRVSERMRQYNGIESRPVYHPPPFADGLYLGAAQPYVFFPSRVELTKRQELVVRAMAHVKRGAAIFAGEGGQIGAMRDLAAHLGLESRVRFLGRVPREEMLALYAHATAVVFPPLDEDYGYVTLEAMLAGKPVVTCGDSGGPLEFVVAGETGLVTEPRPEALAAAIDGLLADPARASRMGRAGRAHYARVVPGWDAVVEALLGR